MRIRVAGDNIISSLGFTSIENVMAVREKQTGLHLYEPDYLGVSDPFMASLVDDERLNLAFEQLKGPLDAYTRFEKMLIVSIADAATDMNLSDARTLFVISTTKGNVELLDESRRGTFGIDRVYLGRSAEMVATFFGNPNVPQVVSNACISGVAAQVVAKRWLECGMYDRVVVAGADVLSKFVVSGFQSFKALSLAECKPFDVLRCGLNIGEGAATLIFERGESGILLEAGAISNDANHISGPSRTGEGLFLALRRVLDNSVVDFVNAHGTATMYNDEMESIALMRAGLQKVPTFSLKAHFGHTLGASGVLETVMSIHALKDNYVTVSRGYETNGVSCPLAIIKHPITRPMNQFIKTVSGFGGCNAAIRVRKEE